MIHIMTMKLLVNCVEYLEGIRAPTILKKDMNAGWDIIYTILKQSTLRPTKWVTLECTKNNSTGPHKPMNIIRNSLLAKITLEYLHTQHSRCIFLQGNNQQ